MSATNRYMCLACGRFWRSEQRPDHCPYCKDKYYVDNVILDAPPSPLNAFSFICPECKNSQVVDFPGDLSFCCVCDATFFPDENLREITQFNHQLKRLEELGI